MHLDNRNRGIIAPGAQGFGLEAAVFKEAVSPATSQAVKKKGWRGGKLEKGGRLDEQQSA
jgi:hypothetical protein